MHRYTLEAAEYITPSTLLLTLIKGVNTRAFSFQPGQYAAISLHRNGRPTPARCFSIVSSPTEPTKLQFSMRVRGHFTKTAAGMLLGESVDVRGPYGGFVIDPGQDNDVVMIAGGIGITPMMSMISFAAATHSPTKMLLIYSCATQDDIPFQPTIQAISAQNPNLSVVYTIGQGEVDKLAGQSVAIGRITPELLENLMPGQFAQKTFFICGPPPFMKGMVNTLRDKGVQPVQIVTEAFAQGSHQQSSLFASWPRSVYVLSAAGLVLTGITIMVNDLVKALPPSTYLGASNISTKSTLTNTRQANLDDLINQLPVLASIGVPSSGVISARQAAVPPAGTPTAPGNAVATTGGASKTTGTTTSNTRTGFTTTTTTTATSPSVPGVVATPQPAAAPPPPAPTPVPPPPKTCTTTQSGVTTCV